MSSSSRAKLKELEALRAQLQRLAKKTFDSGEPQLVDHLNNYLRDLNKKIDGHRANLRRK